MIKALATVLLLAASLPGTNALSSTTFSAISRLSGFAAIPISPLPDRYFTGEEQDRLERQLTPLTRAYHRARIQLAQQRSRRAPQVRPHQIDGNSAYFR